MRSMRLPQRLEFHLDFLAEIRQRAGELLHLGQNADPVVAREQGSLRRRSDIN